MTIAAKVVDRDLILTDLDPVKPIAVELRDYVPYGVTNTLVLQTRG